MQHIIIKNLILKTEIRFLDCQIRNYFKLQKKNQIIKTIIPGNQKSVWDAVKIANNPLHPTSYFVPN